ncbi:MAG: DUF6807 family protein [Caldilineaceae bacterium]
MPYETRFYNNRWWVLTDDQLVSGYNAVELRSYVFPLYTPAGVLVIQEAPPDHPHHQGIWAGLEIDGHDLWNAGSFGKPRHRQTNRAPLVELLPAVEGNGVTFVHEVAWETADGTPLLHEWRAVRFSTRDNCTRVDWYAEFSAPDRPVSLGQTKEAGLALRVPPHWETPFGGVIRNDLGGVGEAACFDQHSLWLNIEGSAGNGKTAGVVLLPRTEPWPWFTRDYGCHVYNPLRHQSVELQPGRSFALALTVLAYDGSRSAEDIDGLVAAQA